MASRTKVGCRFVGLSFLLLQFAMHGCSKSTDANQPELAETISPSTEPKAILFRDLQVDHPKGEPLDPEQLPAEIKSLNGQIVKLTGYMNPTKEKRGNTRFVLVRDNMEPDPLPFYEMVLVHMIEGKTAEFSVRPVSVMGKLSIIEPIKDKKGRVVTVFRIDAESVTLR